VTQKVMEQSSIAALRHRKANAPGISDLGESAAALYASRSQ
jgi:hypothetical protein